MPEPFWNSAEVRFIDYDQTLRNLRRAGAEAKAAYPEIVKVLLFGSLVNGTWTADSDADLIVVVRKELSGFSSRSPYYIFAEGIATDSLIYSETEFERLSRDPESFLAQNLPTAIEL
ncbi:MAG: nucleotidyltransferase domain-containing protein [Acidobacteriia bacterium]|nr:nucleotidyltransferase domain-containing protein [Terriglobia bacterium]